MPIKIRSKRAGFRRCGMAHPAEWIIHPDATFTDEQLKTLNAEPMLQVEIITAENAGAGEQTPEKIAESSATGAKPLAEKSSKKAKE